MGHAKDSGGVWGHSSAIGANSYMIFAISGGLIQEQAFKGWAASESIGLKPLLGCYKGKTENSFIVNYGNLDKLLNNKWLVEQESILVLGPCDSRDRRAAKLVYLTAKGDDIKPGGDDLGVLQSVSRDEALACDAWSYDPHLKEYFICIDPDAVRLCPIGLQAAIDEHCRQHDKPLGENQGTAELIKTYLLARRVI